MGFLNRNKQDNEPVANTANSSDETYKLPKLNPTVVQSNNSKRAKDEALRKDYGIAKRKDGKLL